MQNQVGFQSIWIVLILRLVSNVRVLMLSAFAFSSASYAYSCVEYDEASGTQIRFSSDSVYSKYGFQLFHSSLGVPGPNNYQDLAGQQAKVLDGSFFDNSGVLRYRKVVTTSCVTVYWLDLDGVLTEGDARTSGVIFESMPKMSWSVSKKIDPMTDARSCVVSNSDLKPGPFFHFHQREGFSISAIRGDFPGRAVSVRADKHAAIVGNEAIQGRDALQFLGQIRGGAKSFILSAYEWPHDFAVVSDRMSTEGLMESLDSCERFVNIGK